MKPKLLLAALLAATLSGSPSSALDLAERVVSELRDQGYFDISVGRTLLGRTRITATSADFDREIVLDPRTGEVLRDYWQAIQGSGQAVDGSVIANPGSPGPGSSGSGSSNSGSGSSNSGSGSSNSGSGSSGSGNSGSGSSGSGHSGSGGGSSDDDDDDDDD